MSRFAGDLLATARNLRRQPRHAAIAVSVLAVGIAVVSLVFNLLEALMFRPLPYAEIDQLVVATGRRAFVERLRYRDWDFEPFPELTGTPFFQTAGAALGGEVTLGGAAPERVRAAAVTAGFFSTLGVSAILGRTFTLEERPERTPLALVSERSWRRRFAGNPNVIGQAVVLNGRLFTVIGVLPSAVQLPNSPEFWIPRGIDAQLGGASPAHLVIVRLRRGVTPADAREELVRVMAAHYPLVPSELPFVRASRLRDALLEPMRLPLALMTTIALIILLVSCVNISGLLLIRLSARGREFAVRRALGATRAGIGSLVLVESLVLALAGAAFATPLVLWLSHIGQTLVPASWLRVSDLRLGAWSLASAALLAVLCSVLVSVPSWISIWRDRELQVLRGSGRSTVGPLQVRLQRMLVSAQIAAAVLLLASAVTVIRRVTEVLAVDLGVRGEDAIAAQFELPAARYARWEDVLRFYREVEEELRRLPDVRSVGSTNRLPGDEAGSPIVTAIQIDGLERPEARVFELTATPGYFDAVGLDVIAGRGFSVADGPEAPRVVIVSVGAARAVGLTPPELIGRRFDLSPYNPDRSWAEIIGVVGRDLRMDGGEHTEMPAVFMPFEQRPRRSAYTVVRGRGDPRALPPLIRAVRERVDAEVPLFNVRTFDEVRATSVAQRQVSFMVGLMLGLLALLEAALGLYAVIGFVVQRRESEIGLRMALGASRGTICVSTLLSSVRLTVAGIAVGTVAAVVGWKIAASRLTNFGQLEVSTLLMIGSGVLVVALAATTGPAFRSGRIDPAAVMRAE